MDQGTFRKEGKEMSQATQAKPKTTKRVGFGWDGGFICKGCKRFHYFFQYKSPTASVLFPRGDFSVIRIHCLDGDLDQTYDYKHTEVMYPIREPTEIKKKVGELEKRLAGLEGEFRSFRENYSQQLDKAKK